MWKPITVITAASAIVLSAGFGVANANDVSTDQPVSAAEVTIELGPVQVLGTRAHQEAGDIVEVAASAGTFETLLTAAREAGLVETLRGEGPLTVFAPTDSAFAKLPEGTLEAVLQDREKLRAILTYHVVAGEVTSDQVVKLDEAETVNGEKVRVRVRDGSVLINDARVVKADVQADNGVIHVIDSVLMPPEKKTGKSGY